MLLQYVFAVVLVVILEMVLVVILVVILVVMVVVVVIDIQTKTIPSKIQGRLSLLLIQQMTILAFVFRNRTNQKHIMCN